MDSEVEMRSTDPIDRLPTQVHNTRCMPVAFSLMTLAMEHPSIELEPPILSREISLVSEQAEIQNLLDPHALQSQSNDRKFTSSPLPAVPSPSAHIMTDEEWSNFTTDVTASLEGKFNGQQYTAVVDEIKTLEMLFKGKFGFDTESYEMPEFDSQVHLQHKISSFLIEYKDPSSLVIIYYGGHGGMDRYDHSVSHANRNWSYTFNGNDSNSPALNRFEVQPTILRRNGDVLFILDCCVAMSLIRSRITGIKELHSRTWKLADLRRQFDIAELYNRLAHDTTEVHASSPSEDSSHDAISLVPLLEAANDPATRTLISGAVGPRVEIQLMIAVEDVVTQRVENWTRWFSRNAPASIVKIVVSRASGHI